MSPAELRALAKRIRLATGEPARTMGEEAYGLLRAAILSGALKPGERLPITDLAKASGMSRMPIREALAQLDRDGLVESQPRQIANVAELSPEDLKDVYETRLSLEVPAIASAASRFTSEDRVVAAERLGELRGALDRGDHQAALKAHTEFHFALYRTRSTRWLRRLISPLWNSSERYRWAIRGEDLAPLGASLGEHERMLSACQAGEVEVATVALRDHLLATGNALYREMGGSGALLAGRRCLPRSEDRGFVR